MKEQPPFESLDQVAQTTASALVKIAADSAFQLFQDKRFRRPAKLDRLIQTEQGADMGTSMLLSVSLVCRPGR